MKSIARYDYSEIFNKINDSVILNPTPVKPRRFVYHVTRPSRRLDIMCEGIKPFPTMDKKYRLAFVNNMPPWRYVDDFWPLPIDSYDFSAQNNSGTDLEFYSGYDFWRIDTLKANVTWHIDPYMERDCYSYQCGYPDNFLCTPSVIPADALDLMEYDMESFNRHLQASKGGHPELIFSDFNRMIRYRRERASNPSIIPKAA